MSPIKKNKVRTMAIEIFSRDVVFMNVNVTSVGKGDHFLVLDLQKYLIWEEHDHV